ncbi:NAD(P)H-dependent glycerol-3-phosphate dehydrogenase [Candidatus Megaera venefica]|uniref:Glycerol-3-phosphate dehydrogenase n=1 Tax=Candidatus Megaera venefica TaxID=2055910 RepID=A0ABU5NAS0_9RICK|nr:NAD(P)H-dependent glycerol-3-phosphate dehydrogenase [Candidatus Megaera venefica]MEA0970236.1 NAD(P)H-dependent glycerol-3-phosphate dehydrogenase [Candidatus Megaera venefica]
MKKLKNFAVIGGGSWGTALACLVARVYGSALIYTPEVNIVDEINNHHKNSKYLDDTALPSGITATVSLLDVASYDVIILAVPSQAFEIVIQELKQIGLSSKTVFLIATKGMCQEPLQLFSTKMEQEFDNPYVFISGPNFAKEVAVGNFASITITSKDQPLARYIADELSSEQLDVSVSTDIITVQIAGIVKNIIAIKSGILMAQGYGENARAWLVSKGLEEIAIISKALGGNQESLTLPAVIGDLVLTSYSTTSRNTKFGYEFHQNNYSKEFLANYPVLVEGASAAKLLHSFVSNYNLDLPMTSSVAKLVI